MFTIQSSFLDSYNTVDNIDVISDEYMSIVDFEERVAWLCDILEESKVYTYSLQGLGLDWYLDLSADLPIIVEQLPGVIKKVQSQKACILELYEQGVERVLIFTPNSEGAELYEISCETLIVREKIGDKVLIESQALLDMLNEFYNNFLESCHKLTLIPVSKLIGQ